MAMIAEKYMLGPEIAGQSLENGEKLYLGTAKSNKKARYAIRMIRKDTLSEESKALLEKDIPVLKQLNHPNVAKLVDVCEESGSLYLVMEYCEGGELWRNLLKRDDYSEEEARRILRSVAEALAYCHSQNVTVKDLSLSDIFLTADSDNAQIKLMSVGIPRQRTMESRSSWAYVAPEYLKKELYTQPVDMWAFGVLVFVLLCGYPPFQGSTDTELFRQIKGGTFTFDSNDWQDPLDEVKDMIRHLLKLDPSKRLTASAVLSHPWMSAEVKAVSLKHALRELQQTYERQAESPRMANGSRSTKVKKASSSSLDSQNGTQKQMKRKIKKPKPIHPLDLDLFRVAMLPLVGSMLVALGMFHLSPVPVSGKERSSSFDVVFGSCVLCYLVILHTSRCVTLGLHYLGEILWGCNIALLLAGVGIATNRPLMVGTAVCVVAVDQSCWYIDVLGYLLTGKFPVGVAKYMKAPTTTWVHALTGTHHLWFIPIAIAWLGPHGGIPSGSYWGSVLVTTVIASMARILTPFAVLHGVDSKVVHVWNINLCYEFYEDVAIPPLHILDHRPPYLFLPFLVLVCNFILNVVPVAVVIALSRVPFGGEFSHPSDWYLGFAPLQNSFA